MGTTKKIIVRSLLAVFALSLLSTDAMAVCVLGFGECTHTDCLEKHLSGCETANCRRSAYDICNAKFQGPLKNPLLVEGKDYDFIVSTR